MLRQKHEASEHEISSELEQRIRADERRRVLAERGEREGEREGDWRTTPPPPDEPRVVDPAATPTATTSAPTTPSAAPTDTTAPLTDEPRGWDVRDERTTTVTDEPEVVREDTVTERGFSPGQILIILAGAASLVLGIIAVVRTGLDGSLTDPAETVLWWEHTALLGLFEIGAGVLMILGGLHPAMRWFGGLVGLASIVGGVLILSELDWTMNELGAEREFGWVPIVIGAVAVIGAAIPRVRRTRQVTSTTGTRDDPVIRR